MNRIILAVVLAATSTAQAQPPPAAIVASDAKFSAGDRVKHGPGANGTFPAGNAVVVSRMRNESGQFVYRLQNEAGGLVLPAWIVETDLELISRGAPVMPAPQGGGIIQPQGSSCYGSRAAYGYAPQYYVPQVGAQAGGSCYGYSAGGYGYGQQAPQIICAPAVTVAPEAQAGGCYGREAGGREAGGFARRYGVVGAVHDNRLAVREARADRRDSRLARAEAHQAERGRGHERSVRESRSGCPSSHSARSGGCPQNSQYASRGGCPNTQVSYAPPPVSYSAPATYAAPCCPPPVMQSAAVVEQAPIVLCRYVPPAPQRQVIVKPRRVVNYAAGCPSGNCPRYY